MAVARITEIIGSSEKSWEDAVHNALKRANKTLRGLTGLEITKMNAQIHNGKITEYRAHIKITFILEDTK
jgi:flavin-binding protein dodecin